MSQKEPRKMYEKLRLHYRNEVFDFIYNFIHDYAYAPSQEEIAKACYLSRGSVVRYLDQLEAKGMITREPRIARSIRLMENDPRDKPLSGDDQRRL